MLKGFSPKGTPFSSCGEDMITVRKCLVAGYFGNVAKLSSNGQYLTVRGNVSVTPHPNSVIARYDNNYTVYFFYHIYYISSSFYGFSVL